MFLLPTDGAIEPLRISPADSPVERDRVALRAPARGRP